MRNTIHTLVWSLGLLGALALAAPAGSLAQDMSWEQGREFLEQRLPEGETRNFYRDQLAELGYTITAVTYNEPARYAEYEIVKDNQIYEVRLDLDEEAEGAVAVTVHHK
jgi:hypothetical protein